MQWLNVDGGYKTYGLSVELQEPAIMQYGLDTKATVILAAIQDHIAYWQSTQTEPSAEATIVSPQT